MLGMGRTVTEGKLREYEYVKISDANGTLVYHAEPSGQTPADFPAKSVTDDEIVFENLAHDFPQRVRYRRVGADSLLARIEGTMGGRERSVDFSYGRVRCPGGGGAQARWEFATARRFQSDVVVCEYAVFVIPAGGSAMSSPCC